jgi:hypothetical protein
VGTCHAMGGLGCTGVCTFIALGGLGWAEVAADGYGLGMGTNSKENVGLCYLVKNMH